MIVNLNQYRKKRRRVEAETQAKENRVRFGRSKEERTAELRERERAKKEIENKRLDWLPLLARLLRGADDDEAAWQDLDGGRVNAEQAWWRATTLY